MQKGFTLIELLVVVLIIGILSAIALPQYTVAVEKTRASEALVNLKYAQQAHVLNYLEGGADGGARIEDIMEFSGGKWNESGSLYYCTAHFLYDLSDNTQVIASRCTPKTDCSSCNGNIEYDLGVNTPYGEEGWENAKGCTVYTDLGYKICKGFEGQGFELADQR